MARKKKKKSSRNSLARVNDAHAEVKRLAREKKAAELRLKLARLEAGEDVDLEEYEDDEDDGGASLASGGDLVEGVLGSLGNIGKIMNSMGVQDMTAGDAEGGPGIPFQRHAGTVRNIKIDGRGRVKEVDFQPEEWPPRNENF